MINDFFKVDVFENVNGKDYEFEYGGTNEGDNKAKQDAKMRLLDFIEKI